MTKAEKLQKGIERLARHGLNLFTSFPIRQLPVDLLEKIPTRTGDNTLILIGHAGQRLWQQMRAQQAFSQADPVDCYSLQKMREFSHLALNDAPVTIHYPGNSPLDLQRLGALAGWHHPSPMGIGINQRWGLWFAYRVVLTTPQELPEIRQKQGSASPCKHCDDTPCIQTCPARATNLENGLDLEKCAHYRLLDNSSCAGRCIARQSCPVAAESGYSIEQINYHYQKSLETLQQFYGKKS